MRRVLFQLASLLFAVICGAEETSHVATPMRLDYYAFRRWDKQEKPDPAALQTLSIAIFFDPLVPDAAGHLKVDDAFVAGLAHLKAMKAPKTEIWLGLGSLSAVMGNEAAMGTLGKDVAALCAQHGFAGVDIDWENADVSAEAYKAAVEHIVAAVKPHRIRVSVSHGMGATFVKRTEAVAELVDLVNIQAYYSLGNSCSVEAVAKRLDAYIRAGVPARKICLGLPVYGMLDMAANREAKSKTVSYRDILAKGGSPTANQWTNPGNGLTYHYSGLPLIAEKVEYAKRSGFAGVFTWEMTCDTPYAEPNSLLRRIDRSLGLAP